MRYPASETAEKHKRILEEATRLFRERGFSGVSVSEIMKATGLTHGPFYNHFASKEELMAESVAQGFRVTLDGIDESFNSEESRAQYLDRYLSAKHRDDPGNGCLMAALASEVRQEPQVRGPFTANLKAVIEKMASYLTMRGKHSARGESIRTLASTVGALVLARAVDDEDFSEEILREVRQGL